MAHCALELGATAPPEQLRIFDDYIRRDPGKAAYLRVVSAERGAIGGALGGAATAEKREELAQELGVDSVPLGMSEQQIRELAQELDPEEFADAVAENNSAFGAIGGAAAADKRDELAQDLGVDAVPLGMKHQLIQALAQELDRDEFADAVAENNAALAAEGGRANAETQRVRSADKHYQYIIG